MRRHKNLAFCVPTNKRGEVSCFRRKFHSLGLVSRPYFFVLQTVFVRTFFFHLQISVSVWGGGGALRGNKLPPCKSCRFLSCFAFGESGSPDGDNSLYLQRSFSLVR